MTPEKTKRIASIAIVLLMVFSAFGVVVSTFTPTERVTYNDVMFEKTDRGWQTGGRTFTFLPTDVEGILVPEDAAARLKGVRSIAVTYDGEVESPEYLGNIQYYMEQQLRDAVFVRRGLTTAIGGLPAIRCADATPYEPVVYVRLANDTAIEQNDSCITVRASSVEELGLQAERLTYIMLGIMHG